MSRYIDSEKLIAEIERRMNDYDASIEKNYGKKKSLKAERDSWKWAECKCILSLIASLQQQEQPEADLEKELDRIWFDNKLGDYFDNDALDYAHIRTLCKHFYELGLNARKEE